MKLYTFDGVTPELDLLPLAARRALDRAGCKLSLEGFRSLPLDARRLLVEEGCQGEPQRDVVLGLVLHARPHAVDIPILPEPDPACVPLPLQTQLGEGRPLGDSVWSALSPLDRYALAKVAGRENPERLQAAYQEIVGQSSWSSHIRPTGGVRMVRVSSKEPTVRRARAESWVSMSPQAFSRLQAASGPKGDVLGTARLAGILATKKTSDWIPLCHPLSLTHAELEFELDAHGSRVRVSCTTEVVARTGVEMEALVGASAAALTIYDMLKSVDRGMTIGPTRLLEKSGGKSGPFAQPGGSEPSRVDDEEEPR